MNTTTLTALVELLATTPFPVFLTGAGISVASGIPTFRGPDPGAVWTRDTTTKGTLAHFHQRPVDHWLWYLDRFAICHAAHPNPAHEALAGIERNILIRAATPLLVTQNIDGLHALAGTRELVEVHGTSRAIRCARHGCRNGAPAGSLPWDERLFEAFRADPRIQTLPRCSLCRKLLRPHVLWFDEIYAGHADYQWDRVRVAFMQMSALVIIGTSLSVGVTDLALRVAAEEEVPVWVIDPHIAEVPHARAKLVREPAEVLLPSVREALGGA